MAEISTRNLTALPDINGLQRLLQSMAMLDAILCSFEGGGYYFFNSNWAKGQRIGAMHNGSGDFFHAVFTRHGCWLKGFDHESVMSPWQTNPPRVWPGILDSVPREFTHCLREPAFVLEETTFCIWRRFEDDAWQRGTITYPESADPDGSGWLLSPLDGRPATYKTWADEYYETDDGPRDIPLSAVTAIYNHVPLTPELLQSINPETTTKKLRLQIDLIGYPAMQ